MFFKKKTGFFFSTEIIHLFTDLFSVSFLIISTFDKEMWKSQSVNALKFVTKLESAKKDLGFQHLMFGMIYLNYNLNF